ncbi:hypothetical protein BS50DRAFT_63547 [Corynespora cassiicola Philippines]|uniref:Uncharacterized protein n=1 Tax=Corynespora cassiicola Philippines TaxID=1448308 RepID=A0A2T2NKQ8_CORCC|nr:hypothetical protein BS50DRAFT_63547 [Corynespora cassiicola Philippines]
MKRTNEDLPPMLAFAAKKHTYIWTCCGCGRSRNNINSAHCPGCGHGRCAYCAITRVQTRPHFSGVPDPDQPSSYSDEAIYPQDPPRIRAQPSITE